MPLYVYECRNAHVTEDVRTVDERRAPMTCRKCSSPASLVIQPTFLSPDIAPYIAVAGDRAGKPITSRKEHKEFLKRNRLVEVGNEPIKQKPANFRPARGEVREEMKKVVPEVLRKYRA